MKASINAADNLGRTCRWIGFTGLVAVVATAQQPGVTSPVASSPPLADRWPIRIAQDQAERRDG
jgi:hypothetical protein